MMDSIWKLTAEQVEKAIHDCSTYASYVGAQYCAEGINMQAIADELNARVERKIEAEIAERICRCQWTPTACRFICASQCRHVKPRTIEDVLHDFWEEWESHPIDAEWGVRLERLRESEAKYADEIRELMEVDR